MEHRDVEAGSLSGGGHHGQVLHAKCLPVVRITGQYELNRLLVRDSTS